MKSVITLCTILLLSTAPGMIRASGKLTGAPDPERTCYDVKHYHIEVRLTPTEKRISSLCRITFDMLSESQVIRFDLHRNMKVTSVMLRGQEVMYKRLDDRIYLKPGTRLLKGETHTAEIRYEGKPDTALLPPWKSGMVWSADTEGNPWVGLTCESRGASVWMPCKDLWSDEADSMDMILSVPPGLTGVSNGQPAGVREEKDGYRSFRWKVRNPINNYSISINAGAYTEIRDTFDGLHRLPLTYFVLKENAGKAERHFLQVHKMLEAFENYFGPYPFPADGYKLVETPYWGMEHQSCIAYGNHYRNNRFGFDFIIIHESGHEWFANSITAYDPADMWIHESFTTYAEALFVEYTGNRTLASEYLLEQKKKIAYKSAMQGKRGVAWHDWKDSDIYYKGTWMLHTLRNSLGNDSLWFGFLKEMNRRFRHRIVSTEDVISLYEESCGEKRDVFFRQYLMQREIPVLKIRAVENRDGRIRYTLQLKKCEKGFALPVHFKIPGAGTLTLLLSETAVETLLPAGFDLYAVLERDYLLRLDRRD